jgi:hypothetical protein
MDLTERCSGLGIVMGIGNMVRVLIQKTRAHWNAPQIVATRTAFYNRRIHEPDRSNPHDDRP